jgi:hypothetical protein
MFVGSLGVIMRPTSVYITSMADLQEENINRKRKESKLDITSSSMA